MAKTNQDDTRQRPDALPNALFDPAGAMSGLEPLLHAGNRWVETWVAMGSEILEFSRARLDRSVEMTRAIARTSSIDQAVELQTDYARSMMRDYMDEAGKIADMSTRAMLDGLTAWHAGARANGGARRAP